MRLPSSGLTLLVGFVLAASTLVSAQSATTSLRGTVYDSKGAVVADAAVTITDNQTGFCALPRPAVKVSTSLCSFRLQRMW